MHSQTQTLFSVTPPNVPSFIQPLIEAYMPDTKNQRTQLNRCLYPEPYYGDFTQCSAVLLTHNPGDSTLHWKGKGSQFESMVCHSRAPEQAYYAMAAPPAFPNPATNNRFYQSITTQLHKHFEGIQTFKYQPFIRDLLPYHSGEFGRVNMPACAAYLYTYFFNQVITASFQSELYHRINAGGKRPATILYARGKAWKDAHYGLGSIGWQCIARLYSYCSVYKADFQKIQAIQGFDINSYPQGICEHDIYIVVITQARPGAKYGVYLNNRAPLQPIALADIIATYEKAAQDEIQYIPPSKDMDIFIQTIC